MLVNEGRSFREVCQKNGIAVTHQRQVLYEVMKTMHRHPSSADTYAQVKRGCRLSRGLSFTKTYIYLWRAASSAR
jgi:Fe2+ or Zn2+ uptake regulation protein